MAFSPIGEGLRKSPGQETREIGEFSPVKPQRSRIQQSSVDKSAFSKDQTRNSMFDSQTVLMEGVLKKLSSSPAINLWQDRFFRLETHYLNYFSVGAKGGAEGEFKGNIDLNQIEHVLQEDNVLKLTTTSGEVAQLKAKSQEEAAAWCTSIKDASPAVLQSPLSAAEIALFAPNSSTKRHTTRVKQAMSSLLRAVTHTPIRVPQGKGNAADGAQNTSNDHSSNVFEKDDVDELCLVEAEVARGKAAAKQRVRANIQAFKAGKPDGNFMEFLEYFEPADYQNYKRGADANAEEMGPAYPHYYKEVWDAEVARAAAGEHDRSVLGPMTNVGAKQCQMDLGRETMVVDGTDFLGKDFLLSLRSLLCEKYDDEIAAAIEPVLLQLCSRTSWGGDLYLGVRAQLGGRFFSNTNALVPAREATPPLQFLLGEDAVQCTMQVRPPHPLLSLSPPSLSPPSPPSPPSPFPLSPLAASVCLTYFSPPLLLCLIIFLPSSPPRRPRSSHLSGRLLSIYSRNARCVWWRS
jgi:hypothetical protein